MKYPLVEILKKLPGARVIGNEQRFIEQPLQATSHDHNSHSITWISDKNVNLLNDITDGVVICSVSVDQHLLKEHCTYILVDNPRYYFLQVVRDFFFDAGTDGISSKAIIHHTVKLGNSVSIREGVVIEENCMIGEGSRIDCNSVIKRNTIIGSQVIIGANTTIGGVGFGYEKDEQGAYQQIPHIGNVVIEDQVEIGNNSAVDRAVLGSTFLRKNCKIDNLVHIAHGVEIGENSLVIAHAMVAGSVVIGKNVWIAPSASILNQQQVGDNAVIGMGAVVLKNVPSGQTVVGNPAKDINEKKKL